MEEDIKTTAEETAQVVDRGADTACKKELAEYKERYAYLLSDFENHRRREAVETVNRIGRAQAAIFADLMSIVDNFERAFTASEGKEQLAGFDMIYKSLVKLLEKYGVTPMEIAPDAPFDPEYHEALMHVVHEGATSGHVVNVLQKGYMFKGAVLRPAQVSVAQ